MFKDKNSIIGMAIGAIAGSIIGYFFGTRTAKTDVEVVVESTDEK